jgi:hypothetical protein
MMKPRYYLTLLVILAVSAGLMMQAASIDSVTYDEKLHLDSAKEWWSLGHSPSDPFNPPLSKLPYFLLHLAGYDLTSDPFLRLPRLTTIFLSQILIILVVSYAYVLTKSAFLSLIAGSLLAFEPTFLAHAHLATTDLLATLTFFLAIISWQYRSKFSRGGIAFTVSLALLAATKITLLPALLLYLILERLIIRKPLTIKSKSVLLTGVWCLIIIWGIHGFRFHPIINRTPPVPLGGYISTTLHAISAATHPKFESTRKLIYLEEVRGYGWYSYPFIAFLLKSSPSLLILCGIGTWLWSRSSIQKKLMQLAQPAFSVFIIITLGRYSTGIRHLLPIYPFLILFGIVSLTSLPIKTRNALLLLLLPIHIISAMITKDHIAYFTPFVGAAKGGTIISDSNLDWGQSLAQIPYDLKAHGVLGPVYCSFMSPANPSLYGLHCLPIPPAAEITPQWALEKTLLISRTKYYQDGYHQSFLHDINPRMIANKTILMFTRSDL